MAIRDVDDPKEMVDALASTTKETSDNLANEVIARLPSESVGFAARIRVFDGTSYLSFRCIVRQPVPRPVTGQ